MRMVRTVMDAVEVVDLSIPDLETVHARYAAELHEITVAERVSELLGEDGSAERTLRRRRWRAREFEFVHLGLDRDGMTATGKPPSLGALEHHYRRP